MGKIILNLQRNIEHLYNDQKVLVIIKELDGPTPFNLIQRLTRLPKGQLHRILTALIQRGIIRKTTITTATFYSDNHNQRNRGSEL
jgi:DNA-binding HxlR family transcriptional regulator